MNQKHTENLQNGQLLIWSAFTTQKDENFQIFFQEGGRGRSELKMLAVKCFHVHFGNSLLCNIATRTVSNWFR